MKVYIHTKIYKFQLFHIDKNYVYLHVVQHKEMGS